jgi:hypothetical protein
MPDTEALFKCGDEGHSVIGNCMEGTQATQ